MDYESDTITCANRNREASKKLFEQWGRQQQKQQSTLTQQQRQRHSNDQPANSFHQYTSASDITFDSASFLATASSSVSSASLARSRGSGGMSVTTAASASAGASASFTASPKNSCHLAQKDSGATSVGGVPLLTDFYLPPSQGGSTLTPSPLSQQPTMMLHRSPSGAQKKIRQRREEKNQQQLQQQQQNRLSAYSLSGTTAATAAVARSATTEDLSAEQTLKSTYLSSSLISSAAKSASSSTDYKSLVDLHGYRSILSDEGGSHDGRTDESLFFVGGVFAWKRGVVGDENTAHSNDISPASLRLMNSPSTRLGYSYRSDEHPSASSIDKPQRPPRTTDFAAARSGTHQPTPNHHHHHHHQPHSSAYDAELRTLLNHRRQASLGSESPSFFQHTDRSSPLSATANGTHHFGKPTVQKVKEHFQVHPMPSLKLDNGSLSSSSSSSMSPPPETLKKMMPPPVPKKPRQIRAEFSSTPAKSNTANSRNSSTMDRDLTSTYLGGKKPAAESMHRRDDSLNSVGSKTGSSTSSSPSLPHENSTVATPTSTKSFTQSALDSRVVDDHRFPNGKENLGGVAKRLINTFEYGNGGGDTNATRFSSNVTALRATTAEPCAIPLTPSALANFNAAREGSTVTTNRLKSSEPIATSVDKRRHSIHSAGIPPPLPSNGDSRLPSFLDDESEEVSASGSSRFGDSNASSSGGGYGSSDYSAYRHLPSSLLRANAEDHRFHGDDLEALSSSTSTRTTPPVHSPSLLSLQNSLNHALHNPEAHSAEQLAALEQRRLQSIDALSKKLCDREDDLRAVYRDLETIDQSRVAIFETLLSSGSQYSRLLSRIKMHIEEGERLVELETRLKHQLDKLNAMAMAIAEEYRSSEEQFMLRRRHRLREQLHDTDLIRATYEERDRAFDAELESSGLFAYNPNMLREWRFCNDTILKLNIERRQIEDRLESVRLQLDALRAMSVVIDLDAIEQSAKIGNSTTPLSRSSEKTN